MYIKNIDSEVEERLKQYVLPSRIPSLCTRSTRAGIEWCRCHRAQFVWRGHAETPTTRAGPWPDFAVRLE